MDRDPRTTPLEITLRRREKKLEIAFADEAPFLHPAEYLRVWSPSSEVMGHAPSQATLQTGKRHIGIDAIEAVGHYALKLRFSDGHDTGFFTWSYLRLLGEEHDRRWAEYLTRLAAAGGSRDDPLLREQHVHPAPSSCRIGGDRR
ncbi:MAG: DUF971 domain-containing protein [Hydrogenophilus sp.]|nr:DUF971 domain-containing protein [Hydrogenophilus sp.]